MANQRIFIIDNREFPDPDAAQPYGPFTMTPEDVRQYYAAYFAELSNAETKESKRPDPAALARLKAAGKTDAEAEAAVKTEEHGMQDIFEFKKRVGTKGEGPNPERAHYVASGPVTCPKCGKKVCFLGHFEGNPMCNDCVETELRLTYVQMEAKGYIKITKTGVIITELGMDVWRQASGI